MPPNVLPAIPTSRKGSRDLAYINFFAPRRC